MKTARMLVMVYLCAFSVSAPAAAQSGEHPAELKLDGPPAPVPPAVVSRDAEGHVTVRAVRIPEPLTLDGRLDEASYQSVPAIEDFVQQEPAEGEPATERTEAWVFFDAENLYFSARCWDSQPERMVANEMRRDSSNLSQNEYLAVVLDTFYDRRNGVMFLINPLGGMLDESFADERNPSRDWNTVWVGKTEHFDQGWTVEIAIPFKSLRYKPGTSQVWGLNLNRFIRWKNERTFLSPISASFGNNGVLRVSSAATLVGVEAPALGKNLEIKPYAIGGITTDRRRNVTNDFSRDIGFDVKYGITRGLTADLTVNTDFAQVEEDEQQVNLSRFSLFFPEKREFFLEGQGIFNFGGRGTGGGDGGQGDTPILFFSRQIGLSQGRPVPILAGGRLTGKAGPYSIGIVNIQTDADPHVSAQATNFTVVRIKRDVLRRSTIGALFTDRSVSTRGTGSNQVFGVDGLFSFYENLRLNTYLVGTRTPGLSGQDTSYRTQMSYNGDRYGAQLERLMVGENFNPEVGFLRRRDFTKNRAQLRFSPRPRSIQSVRKFFYEAAYEYFTTGTGRLESRETQAEFITEFQNSDRITVQFVRSYELLESPFAIASNVTIPVGGYGFQNLVTGYQLGQQRRLSGSASLERGTFFSGHQTVATYRGRLEITPRLSIDPSVSINWVDLAEGKFTSRLLSTRVTSTLTPRMFVAALIQYNSSVNSFSSNVRFRWEYLPGSELFVVYTEGRDTRTHGFPTLENRGFVVKITRLFRP